jgi:hypothetical protein
MQNIFKEATPKVSLTGFRLLACMDKFPDYRNSILNNRNSTLDIPFGPNWGIPRVIDWLLKKNYANEPITDGYGHYWQSKVLLANKKFC